MITSVCERLQAFTSVCERLRARQVAFGRVWSRLVAFSRANFFFFWSGHVWACSVISCRILSAFFVISRHSSSFFVPKCFFRVWRATGGCGSGWAGRAAVCCAWFPQPGAGCASCHDNSFQIGLQLRQGRGCVGSFCEQLYYRIGEFAVRCIPRGASQILVRQSKAKRLKQLRPGLTERSRAECRHRQGIPFGLLIPFSSSTPFHLNEKLGCTLAREARVGAEQLGCALFRPRTTIYRIAVTLSTENAQNVQIGVRLDTVEVPVSAPRAGESKNGGGISAASGLMGRLQATCGARRSAVPCKQLRAFTSVCLQLRAFACSSAPGRV